LENKNIIEELIYDVKDLSNRIKLMDGLIMQIENVELRKDYTFQLVEVIQQYKQITELLIIELNKYVREENKSGGPINFVYRKILKELSS
jgi:fructose-1,6-bisphosphatase